VNFPGGASETEAAVRNKSTTKVRLVDRYGVPRQFIKNRCFSIANCQQTQTAGCGGGKIKITEEGVAKFLLERMK